MAEKVQWQDVTSYTHSERGVRQPDTWAVVFNKVRICVTRNHRDYPGEWVMHCHVLLIDTHPLGFPSDARKEDVQLKAIAVARRKAGVINATLEALSDAFMKG